METIFRPSKIARPADSSNCLKTKRNGSPPVGLGLALGTGGSGENQQMPTTPNSAKSYGFTILQMQELQLQSVIYKYIETGCPVPYHLLFPIWRSLSNSFANFNSNIYYPNLMRGSSQMQLECRNGMDPEPGRCKRTDGKKWRCSKEALPDQKYCERHMHRGRQRTRKLMEVAAQMNTTNASTDLSICLPNAAANPTPRSAFCTNFEVGKN